MLVNAAAQLIEALDYVGELADLRSLPRCGPDARGRLRVDLGIGSGTDGPDFADLDLLLINQPPGTD